MANEYDELIPKANDYDAQVQIEGDQPKQRLRASMFGAVRQNPDEYGKAKQLERMTGVPAPVVARNLPDVEQRAKLNEYDALLGTKTGDALQNPDFARLAHDDTGNLSAVEETLKPRGKPLLSNSEYSDLIREIKRRNPVLDWDTARSAAAQQADVVGDATPLINGSIKGPRPTLTSIVSGLWQSLAGGAEEARQGTRYQFADAIGDTDMQADALRQYKATKFETQVTTPDITSPTGKLLYGGAANVVQNIPILAAAIATRNPSLAAGLAAVQTEAQAYPKYRERGGSAGEAALGAGTEGVIEYATEKIPLSFLAEKFGKVPLWQLFVGDQAREQITEQLATHGQDLTDTLIANPNATMADYLKSRPDAALQTAVAVLMQGVVLGGAHAAATKMAGKTEASMRAEQDQQMFTKLAALAKASKVRERDPQSFAAFVDAAAADGPVTDVYIDARTLMQAAGEALPEIVKASPALAAQIDEALTTGGDVRIPIGEYAAGIAATDANATLMPHLRTSPEGMSMEESKTFMQGQADEFKAEAEKILEEKQHDATFRESSATVERELLTQINAMNRHTPDVNTGYAKLMASFYTVQAARHGMTPEEMYVRYPVRFASQTPAGAGLDQIAPESAAVVAHVKGSKVAHVVYHGSAANIDKFRDNDRGGLLYFTRNVDEAHHYAERAAEDRTESAYGEYDDGGPVVYPVYISLKNPFDPTNIKHVKRVGGLDFGDGTYEFLEEHAAAIRAAGFDGAFVREASDTLDNERDFAVFDHGQIMSALTGNLMQSAATFDQAKTEPFKRWSNNAPLVTSEEAGTHEFKSGQKVVVEGFHGTARPDRVGTAFKRSRATSGPMAFFTSSPELASSYATGKQDTSLANEDQAYETWFKFKPKGERTATDIVRAWHRLDHETQQKIAEIAPTLRDSEDADAVIAIDGNKSGNGSYDYNLSETQRGYDKRGNPLKALVEDWLNSGVLFGREERFMEVLRAVGFPMKDVVYDDPNATAPFVYKTFIAMQHPLVTKDMPQEVVDALNAAAKRDRTRAQEHGADIFDKNTRTLREWVAEFSRPDHDYVWTSIPDKVTKLLTELGYDGIIDESGKGGGEKHPVYIPFRENQVKSAIGNKGTFGSTSNILHQDTIDNDTGEVDEAPPFYSQLTKLLDTAKMNTAPAAQWVSFIKSLSNKGVKKEEIEMSGVLDWLDVVGDPNRYKLIGGKGEVLMIGGEDYKAAWEKDMGGEGRSIVKTDGKVTKQQVLDYLAANGVKVETKMLGEPPKPKKEKPGTAVAVVDDVPEGYTLTPNGDEFYIRSPSGARHEGTREVVTAWARQMAEHGDTLEAQLPPDYAIVPAEGGTFELEDPDGNIVAEYPSRAEAVTAAIADYDENFGITDEQIEERARELWENDSDSRYESNLEYARQSDYNQYEIKLVTPNYRIIELPPDLFRKEPAFGVERIDYATAGIDDVNDLDEPEIERFTDDEFKTYDDAASWVVANVPDPVDESEDPHFIGVFEEADRETDPHALKEDAESEASTMQDRLVEQDAQSMTEDDSYNNNDTSYYEDRAREELEGERNQPRRPRGWSRVDAGPEVPRLRHEGNWQSQGGRQYREMVLWIDNIEPYNAGDSTHFATDTGGKTVAWSRFKIHDDANGVPTLFVEEIQSQRAQHGKEQGFKKRPSDEERKRLGDLEAAKDEANEARYNALADFNRVAETDYTNPLSVVRMPEERPAAWNELIERREVGGDGEGIQRAHTVLLDADTRHNNAVVAYNTAVRNLQGGNVPIAPFVQETQAWVALTLKRLLRYAVDNGITQVAWTTGAENAVRYGTADRVDSLKWSKVEGGIQIEAIKDGKAVVDRKLDNQIELSHAIGARVAQGIINDPNQSGEIEASDLDTINGLGMQTFYGDAKGVDPKGKPAIVPLVADKLVKNLGGEGVVQIPISVTEKGQHFDGAAGFEITPAMAEKIKGGQTLFQKEGGTPRGAISFGDSVRSPSTISLLAGADLSTFLHESGHFYLEVLTDMATQPDAPAEVKADLQKLLNWFRPGMSVPEWQAMTIDQKRMYHEQFARGFESYLFEGRAPSQELSGLFSRFRAWLLNVYRSLAALKVEITPEVRGVMDRMLATNEQILAAEAARNFAPLFATKPDNVTDDEWKAYQESDIGATQEAVDQLQRRSLRDMQWLTNARGRELKRLQKLAATRRKQVDREVTAEVQQQPVYAAQRWLKTGVLPDGTQTVGAKLDLPALKEMYGEGPAAPWRYLNVGTHGLAGNEGLRPDQVAEMFGFTSGDHLVRSILAATPEAQEVEGQADRRMLERYGDLSDDNAISKAADKAVHNEMRAKVIATELRWAERAAGGKKTMAKAAKEFAANIIARKKVKDLKPAQFAAAEARAAKAAEKALGKNLVEVATEKRNQLVNNYATRAAHDAVDEIERGLRYLKRVGDSKSVDPAYREQIDAMLERFELRKVTQKDLARRQSLLEWVEAQREQGFEPAIDPELLNEARRQSYRELTVEEFRGLIDAVRNIEHLGRLKKKLLTARDKREFAQRVDEAATSIHDNAKKTVPVKLESNTWADKMKSGVTEFFAMHRKLASLLREMDGFKDAGALWELIGRPMNDAGNREAVMREEATMRLVDIFKPLAKLKMKEKVFIPEINASLSREGRIMVALNAGNEGNLQRLLDGDHWTPAQVRAIIDTLSKPEMDFVQAIWDFVGSYRTQIGEQQKRLTGVEPEWVEATPVETRHGTYRGGYIPAKYDTSRSTRSLSDEAAAGVMDQWRAKKGFAKTRDSFTKGRADKVVDRPLRKDFGVITQHATEVTHRLAYQEFLVDATRLLRAAPIDNAIREHYGPEALKAMRDAIEDIAAGEVGAQNAFERGINYVRTGATIAGLGWRLTTALLQPIGLTQSMVRIGARHVGAGLVEWIGDAVKMENTVKRIYEKSDFMRLRGKTMQREISEIMNTVNDKGSAITSSYFYLIQKLQIVADVPTWLGQYHKAVAGGADEAGAVAQADQAVLDAQGGGQLKDLAKIQRGGPMLKLFTNFYSFFSTTYNLTSESVGRTDFKNPLSIGRMAVDMLLLYSVPAALGTLMKAALHGEDDEEKLIRQLIADQLTYLFGTMVGLREFAGGIQTALGLPGDYQGPASVRLAADLAKLGKQAGQGEVDEALLKAMNNVAGVLFHYPAGQVNATADGIYKLTTGQTENPGALLVGAKAK